MSRWDEITPLKRREVETCRLLRRRRKIVFRRLGCWKARRAHAGDRWKIWDFHALLRNRTCRLLWILVAFLGVSSSSDIEIVRVRRASRVAGVWWEVWVDFVRCEVKIVDWRRWTAFVISIGRAPWVSVFFPEILKRLHGRRCRLQRIAEAAEIAETTEAREEASKAFREWRNESGKVEAVFVDFRRFQIKWQIVRVLWIHQRHFVALITWLCLDSNVEQSWKVPRVNKHSQLPWISLRVAKMIEAWMHKTAPTE